MLDGVLEYAGGDATLLLALRKVVRLDDGNVAGVTRGGRGGTLGAGHLVQEELLLVKPLVVRDVEHATDAVALVRPEKVIHALLAPVGPTMLALDKNVGVNNRVDERELVAAWIELALQITDQLRAACSVVAEVAERLGDILV